MKQQSALEDLDILEELDLGCHTLFLMSDGSVDLLANDEQTPHFADNGLHLDSDETYRLFISLHEQFKRQQICWDERTSHAAGREERTQRVSEYFLIEE